MLFIVYYIYALPGMQVEVSSLRLKYNSIDGKDAPFVIGSRGAQIGLQCSIHGSELNWQKRSKSWHDWHERVLESNEQKTESEEKDSQDSNVEMFVSRRVWFSDNYVLNTFSDRNISDLGNAEMLLELITSIDQDGEKKDVVLGSTRVSLFPILENRNIYESIEVDIVPDTGIQSASVDVVIELGSDLTAFLAGGIILSIENCEVHNLSKSIIQNIVDSSILEPELEEGVDTLSEEQKEAIVEAVENSETNQLEIVITSANVHILEEKVDLQSSNEETTLSTEEKTDEPQSARSSKEEKTDVPQSARSSREEKGAELTSSTQSNEESETSYGWPLLSTRLRIYYDKENESWYATDKTNPQYPRRFISLDSVVELQQDWTNHVNVIIKRQNIRKLVTVDLAELFEPSIISHGVVGTDSAGENQVSFHSVISEPFVKEMSRSSSTNGISESILDVAPKQVCDFHKQLESVDEPESKSSRELSFGDVTQLRTIALDEEFQGRWNRAEDLWMRCVNIDPASMCGWAMACMRQGLVAQACVLLKKCIALEDTYFDYDPSFLLELCEYELEKRDHFTEEIPVFAESAHTPYVYLAHLALELRLLRPAQYYIVRARSLLDGSVDDVFVATELLRAKFKACQKKYQVSLSILDDLKASIDTATSRDDQSPILLAILVGQRGEIFDMCKKPKQSRDAYRAAYAHVEESTSQNRSLIANDLLDSERAWTVRIVRRLALLAIHMNDYKTAMQYIDDLLVQDENLFWVWLLRGRCCIAMENFTEASRSLRHACTLDSENPDAWAYQAFLQLRKGNILESTMNLKLALSNGFADRDLLESISQVASERSPEISKLVHQRLEAIDFDLEEDETNSDNI